MDIAKKLHIEKIIMLYCIIVYPYINIMQDNSYMDKADVNSYSYSKTGWLVMPTETFIYRYLHK